MSEVSRRKFLVGAGLTTGALAALSVGAGSASAAYTAFPWPYATLDVNLVRQRAYNNYYVGGCMYASAAALITTLIETAGTPWDTLPVDMFKYGSGGIATWGTVCGAPHGAAWVITAVAGTNDTNLINSLFQWYCNTAFPSTNMDAYAKFTRQKTAIPNSPLCHASASDWCFTTRNKINSDARKDRCAKVAGDTAAKAAELLNALKAGTYVADFVQPNADCSGCHVGATSTYDHVQMKSTCTDYCHVGTKNGSTHY